MFVLTQALSETDGKTWLGVLPTPTPGREAESLMGHPLSFLRGRRPLKQTKNYFILREKLDNLSSIRKFLPQTFMLRTLDYRISTFMEYFCRFQDNCIYFDFYFTFLQKSQFFLFHFLNSQAFPSFSQNIFFFEHSQYFDTLPLNLVVFLIFFENYSLFCFDVVNFSQKKARFFNHLSHFVYNLMSDLQIKSFEHKYSQTLIIMKTGLWSSMPMKVKPSQFTT